jgi:endonuclease/exonuclease/phosphatase family metal-dependent hydrolase
VRLVDFNIHSAIGLDGRLDPDRVADEIEAQHPDVVVLQEVSLGWTLAGTTDVGEWLARRLRMQPVWGPAADHQFGNLILTRLPVRRTTTVPLPQGPGRMARSYVTAELSLSGGKKLIVFGTHLQLGSEEARVSEADKLLAGAGDSRTVIAGDMNSERGSRPIVRFLGAGLHSPMNAPRFCRIPTSPSGKCVDWIFATQDISLEGVRVIRSDASDHQAIVVSVRSQ